MKLLWMIASVSLLLSGWAIGKDRMAMEEPNGGHAESSIKELALYTTIGLPAKPTLENPQFECGDGWKLLEGYQIDPNGGRNGGGALLCERTDPNKYPVLGQHICLNPGVRYKFCVWVKTENIAKGDHGGATICVEYLKNGKWLTGEYPPGVEGTKDWTRVEFASTVPVEADSARLALYLRAKATGKAWFDDVTIELEKPRMSVYMIQPPMETISPTNGRILLGVNLDGFFCKPPDTINETDIVSRVEVLGNGKIVREMSSPVRDGRISVDVGQLPEGHASLRVTILDTRHKWIFGEASIPVIVAPGKQTPSNACLLDSRGRLIVNGKPFLPVGLYHHSLRAREDVDIIAKSPFNCVMPYNSLYLSFMDSRKKGVEGIREVMDYLHEKKLKIIFSIKDIYAGTTTTHMPPNVLDVEGESAIVEKTVASFKNHPALLSWYICDELPTSMVDRLVSRRREVNHLDPFHPTWAVFNNFKEIPVVYGPTCDIVGFDCYPIWDAKSRDMEQIRFAMEMTCRTAGTPTGMAAWTALQIMNQGCYDKTAKDNRKVYESIFRDPTENEMISMSLLCAIMGARGFVYYSYSDLLGAIGKAASPDYDRRWTEVCGMGQLMVSLAPFLLADAAGPDVKVTVESGKVMAKGFRDDKNSVRVLMAGIGPDDSNATLTISSAAPLRSKFGKCVPLGGGQYRFHGCGICSDILESE
jgi:hypothetical protein